MEKIRGFEIAKGFEDKQINLPIRKTKYSAGYDVEAAEDTVIPSFKKGMAPTLVKTGIKAYMQDDEVLMLYNRSSNPKKKGLILANSVGVVDKDYYGNEDNDGHIMFAFYNIKEEDITIKKGEAIGQAVFQKYFVTDDDNAQGELYITDVVGILVNGGDKVSAYMTKDFEESLGVNSRLQLAEAESILKHRKNVELMTAGVTIIDPANTYVAPEVTVGPDTILHPGTILEGNTVIGERCEIGPYTRLTNVKVGNDTIIHFTYGHDCEVKDGVDVGPYVHLRPNTVLGNKVHVGNFVEVKNSNVGEGTKFPHLSYIGDSDVGSGVNIGCGTITVNYDGKVKHRTTIGDGAFVGCNSNLVAPVTVGNYSYVGAGSTITKNVPDKALAVGRSKQIVKENWVTDDTFKKK